MNKRENAEEMHLENRDFKKNIRVIGTALLLFFIINYFGPPFIKIILSNLYRLMGKDAGFADIIFALYRDVINTVCYASGLCLVIIILRIISKKRLRGARIFKTPDSKILLLGTASALTVFGISALLDEYTANILIKLSLFPVVRTNIIPLQTENFIVYFLTAAFLPSLLETFLFQGVILHMLRKYSDGFAIFFTSVLAALFEQNFVYFLSGFFIAMVTGYYVVRSGSVITGMVMCFIINSMSVMEAVFKELLSIEAYKVFSVFALFVFITAGISVFAYSFHLWENDFKIYTCETQRNMAIPVRDKVRFSILNIGTVIMAATSITLAVFSIRRV